VASCYENGATLNDAVGLIMMAEASSFSTVYYVGVAPEKRGEVTSTNCSPRAPPPSLRPGSRSRARSR
jgi:hypothetical protein